MRYILASSSPRRKDLMKQISPDFLIEPSDVDETYDENLSVEEIVKYLAHIKGEVISNIHPDDIVISADTIVIINNEILGKPKSKDDARRMHYLLREHPHVVLTGFSIFYQGKEINEVVSSTVTFNYNTDEFIEEYLNTDIWKDKAGAYGVQNNDKYPLIKNVEGSIDNVIGFPVKEIKDALKRIK